MPKHYHNQQLKNAIIAHWQNGMNCMSYNNIVNTINASESPFWPRNPPDHIHEIMEAAVMQSENG